MVHVVELHGLVLPECGWLRRRSTTTSRIRPRETRTSLACPSPTWKWRPRTVRNQIENGFPGRTRWQTGLRELLRPERLDQEATRIAVHLGLHDEHAGQPGVPHPDHVPPSASSSAV